MLADALHQVEALQAGGGTDLYRALGAALAALKPYADDGTLKDYLPAIVAMTDGASAPDNHDWLIGQIGTLPYGRQIPIHAISFGEADEAQLKEVSGPTIGRLFRSGGDLAGAVQSAKGYN